VLFRFKYRFLLDQKINLGIWFFNLDYATCQNEIKIDFLQDLGGSDYTAHLLEVIMTAFKISCTFTIDIFPPTSKFFVHQP